MISTVPVLMFHHVTPEPGLVTIAPNTFESQMAYLAKKNFKTLRANEFLEFIRGKLVLSQPSVFITFDDGYLDNYVYAYPVLKRFGFSATIFGITGWLGEGPVRNFAGNERNVACPNHNACASAIRENRHDQVMLRWSEVEKMLGDGTMELHSHTHSHKRWDKIVADGDVRQTLLREDLEKSRRAIERRLGIQSSHLCWPQGYFDQDYQRVARDVGFRALYTTQKNVVTAGCDPFSIGRMVVRDRADYWFASRIWLYSRPLIGKLYSRIRGF